MTFDLTGIGSLADLAKSVVNKIWPDKTEAEKAQMTLALTAMQNEMQLAQGQNEVNKVEAASSSLFVAGWRPFIGWVCGTALLYQFVLRPLAGGIAAAVGHPLPELPGLDGNLWELLAGMLGLGGLRSFEKVKGVAR